MEEIFAERIREIIKNKKELEDKLSVRIKISGKKIFFEGDAVDEYEARMVLEAIGFGFSAKQSLVLKDENMMFRKIHIKDYTKRDLKIVKSRLIGKAGKTRRVMEDISGCKILIGESDVGVIGDAENVEDVVTALVNLIRGSKQGNMYAYLERMNRAKKQQDLI